MALEIISWADLYERYMAGPGFELATHGLQIQHTAYCAALAQHLIMLLYNRPHYYLSDSTTKPTKRHMHPAKTGVSLGIHPVWSVFTMGSRNVSSCGQQKLIRLGDAQADLISLRRAYRSFCWFCRAQAWWNIVYVTPSFNFTRFSFSCIGILSCQLDASGFLF